MDYKNSRIVSPGKKSPSRAKWVVICLIIYYIYMCAIFTIAKMINYSLEQWEKLFWIPFGKLNIAREHIENSLFFIAKTNINCHFP